MAKSICYCEVYDVSHSDVFTCNENILVRQKGCKEVKSQSVDLRRWINTDQYFLLFKKDAKVHDHQLPLIGTCLIITEPKNEETNMLKFYRISQSVYDAQQPMLSLSVSNVDCEKLESCLRKSLQVTYYLVYDLVSDQPSAVSEECLLHITPHYLCITNTKDNKELPIHCIISISSGTTMLYSIENKLSDYLALKITSHAPDYIVELKFRTSHRNVILEKLQSYLKDLCTVKDDKDQIYYVLPDNKSSVSYEEISPPVSAPEVPTKSNSCSSSIVDHLDQSQELKPPPINRGKKPLTTVLKMRKTLTDRNGGIKIHYENNLGELDKKGYQNVDMKTNNKALKLSVSVFASEPVLSNIWLLEIIFIRSEDFEGTFKSVEDSQISCGRHLIVPCRPIQAVTGMVVILDVRSPGFQLLSGEQHISYDKLVEITSASWLVVEKVITYNGNTDSDVSFWSTLKLVSNLDSVNEEICVLDKFKGLKKDLPLSPNVPPPVTFPLTHAVRIQFCQSLDEKDWKYFAASMGLTPDEIRGIEVKQGISKTEYVLRHLEMHLPMSCNYNHVIDVLNEMERGDLTEVLITCNEHAVENTDEIFC